jgi:hypothetical protein
VYANSDVNANEYTSTDEYTNSNPNEYSVSDGYTDSCS